QRSRGTSPRRLLVEVDIAADARRPRLPDAAGESHGLRRDGRRRRIDGDGTRRPSPLLVQIDIAADAGMAGDESDRVRDRRLRADPVGLTEDLELDARGGRMDHMIVAV